ncbi:MAG: FecR domain-containing protein [Bacteroidota bacterium]
MAENPTDFPTPEINVLLTRYAGGEVLTEAETAVLAEWLHGADAASFAHVTGTIHSLLDIPQRIETSLKAKLDAATQEERETPDYTIHRVHFIRRFKWIAAAVILFAFAGGAWFWFTQNAKQPVQTFASVYKNDVAPGKAGGKLKLSNGQMLSIDSMKDGFVIADAGLKLYKENGKIVYKGTATETAYNEIIEDIGRYTSVELPDHSIAWVNSGSSIRYPLHFASDERKITMTGEAAFQVVHNEKQPFRVYVDNQVFEDKGTVFNIRAYSNELVIRTTVLEGLVSIRNTMIKPMQQAQVAKNGQVNFSDKVNTEAVFAWRDGEFSFGNATIEEIMNDAAKWYGVEVIYQDRISQQFGFVGIDRNMPISNLLRNLETIGGVHFEIDGKKITVKK